MPFLGAAIKGILGYVKGQELEKQRILLESIAERDVLGLVPESFRPCALLRLKVAEADVGWTFVERSAMQAYDELQQARLEIVMEQASKEPVTQDEIIKLVHKLDEFSQAATSDIEAVELESYKRIKDIGVDLNNRHSIISNKITELHSQVNETARHLREHDTTFKSLDQKLQLHFERLAKLDMSTNQLSSKLEAVESTLSSSLDNLASRVKSIGLWLIVVGIVSLVEGACIIYHVLR